MNRLREEVVEVNARLLPDLAADVSIVLCHLDLHLLAIGYIGHTQAGILLIEVSHVHNVIDVVLSQLVCKTFDRIEQPHANPTLLLSLFRLGSMNQTVAYAHKHSVDNLNNK